MNLCARPAPAFDGALEAHLLHRLDRTVEGDPGEHLRMREVTRAATHLPDALIRTVPGSFEELDDALLQ